MYKLHDGVTKFCLLSFVRLFPANEEMLEMQEFNHRKDMQW